MSSYLFYIIFCTRFETTLDKSHRGQHQDVYPRLRPKTIRTLTYMATVECLKPDYSIVAQHMSGEVDDYILEIKSKHAQATIKTSPSDVSKDPALIARFKPAEANRIGYMAGVRETVREYRLLRNKS